MPCFLKKTESISVLVHLFFGWFCGTCMNMSYFMGLGKALQRSYYVGFQKMLQLFLKDIEALICFNPQFFHVQHLGTVRTFDFWVTFSSPSFPSKTREKVVYITICSYPSFPSKLPRNCFFPVCLDSFLAATVNFHSNASRKHLFCFSSLPFFATSVPQTKPPRKRRIVSHVLSFSRSWFVSKRAEELSFLLFSMCGHLSGIFPANQSKIRSFSFFFSPTCFKSSEIKILTRFHETHHVLIKFDQAWSDFICVVWGMMNQTTVLNLSILHINWEMMAKQMKNS